MKKYLILSVIFSFFVSTAQANVYHTFTSVDIINTKLLNHIKLGEIFLDIVEETCAYDKQMVTADPTSSMAKLTHNTGMTGDALKNVLDIENWEFNDSLYPMLKTTSEPVDEITYFVAARYVAAAPMFLYINSNDTADYDTYDNVRHCFKVSNKNGVKWKSVNGLVKISEETNFVELLETGWDTLIAYIVTDKYNVVTEKYDIVSKMIPINITEINNDNCIFELDRLLRLKTEPDSIGKVTGGGVYKSGDTATITAVSDNDCYYFKHWINTNGNQISTDANYQPIMLNDCTLIAVFERYDYLVNINTIPTFMGSVSGLVSGLYYCDKEYNLKAINNDTTQYEFVCWTNKNNDTLSKLDTLNLIIKSDTLIIANFKNKTGILEENIYEINIVPNPTENDFTIIFNNIDAQNISIELINVEGRKILDIYKGRISTGKQTYKVDKKLPKGTYIIKFIIDNDKDVIRKLIVK